MAFILNDTTYDDAAEFMEAYFELAAEQLLGHHKAKPAYFVNNQLESTTEIELAIQNGLKLPALILDMPEDHLLDKGGHHAQRLEAAISIIAPFEQGNARHIRKVRYQCRTLARKLVMLMKRDGLRQAPFNGRLITNHIQLDKESLSGMYLGTIAGQLTGWTYEFAWEAPDSLLLGSEDFA
ncbi:hypothetical protein [Telluribacter humicola]|uniref:hypothetical protein n=1 Tax=Telluribacter humicola TaxID=1720261 RepID=UPI001A958610|nr:hypothetical protein [Telluribacter humicola]